MFGHTFLLGDRQDRGYNYGQDRGRSRSRSPNKVSAWGDRSKSLRDRSRSRSLERSGRSFHQAMMERVRSSPPPLQRGPSYNSGNGRETKDSSQEWGRTSGGGHDNGGFSNGPRSSYFGEEEEEGMIPQDEGS